MMYVMLINGVTNALKIRQHLFYKSKLIINKILTNMSHSVSQADSPNQAFTSPHSVIST